MKCPSCGTKNKDGMRFCKICGHSLEASTANDTSYADSYISSENANNTKYHGKKKSGKGIMILIICIVAVLIAIGLCVVILVTGNTSNDERRHISDKSISTEQTATNAELSTSNSDIPSTSTNSAVSMPDCKNQKFSSCESQLKQLGITLDVDYQYSDTIADGYVISQSIEKGADIKDGQKVKLVVSKGAKKCPYDYQQKLTVTASAGSSSASAVFYEWKNGDWKKTANYSATVGSNGIGTTREGSSSSPKGIHKLGVVLSSDTVSTNLPTYHVTGNTCVVDDTGSSYYNQIIELGDIPSGVHYDNIGKGFVNGSTYATIYIEHNGNGFSANGVTSGNGSAIGLRGQYGSLSATYGDVDISSEDMKDLLSRLDANKNPVIELVVK